jgi:hypothetical protein
LDENSLRLAEYLFRRGQYETFNVDDMARALASALA